MSGRRLRRRLADMLTFATFVATSAIRPAPAHADMVLTPQGAAAGFGISTFASGFTTTFGVGPLGIAFPTGGGVLVTDEGGRVWNFARDVDGQTVSSAVLAANFGTSGAIGLVSLDGTIYLSGGATQKVWALKNDGTIDHLVAPAIDSASDYAGGIAADRANGLLYVAGSPTFIDSVNPITGKTAGFALNGQGAGIVVDNTNQMLYVTGNGHIVGFRISDGAEVYDSGLIPTPSGKGVFGLELGSGNLAGNLFAYSNGGDLIEVNITTKQQTVLADGTPGSSGFFATADSNNGTLLVDQLDTIYRVTAGPGGGFGSTPISSVPEPGTIRLLLSGMACVMLLRAGRVRRVLKALLCP